MERLWRLGLRLVAFAVFWAGLASAGGARTEHSSSPKPSAMRVVEVPQAHATASRASRAIRQRPARAAHSPTRNLAKPPGGYLTAATATKATSRHFPACRRLTRRRTARVVKPIIVIDAGHGGRDPGAIGAAGTLEKTVTLATARELARQLRATGRYCIALTRKRDVFVSLQRRVNFVRAQAAALFISIHADWSKHSRAHGASVYISPNQRRGSAVTRLAAVSSSSRAIARSLDGIAPQPIARSPWLQSAIIDNLDDDVRMVADPAREARLYVLRITTVPSVLLELGFLSNRRDETLLRRAKHRAVIARAIRDAIKDYFDGLKARAPQTCTALSARPARHGSLLDNMSARGQGDHLTICR